MHPRLEEQIAAWREEIAASESIGSEGLRELESHLRDTIDGELDAGATLAEAFETARRQIGEPSELEIEFRKINPQFSWARRFLLMVAGYYVISLAFLLVGITQALGNVLALKWLPGSVIALPWPLQFEGPSTFIQWAETRTLEHVHVSIPISLCIRLAATLVALWLASRWLRGKTPRFNRFVLTCSTRKLLTLILFACVLRSLGGSRTFAMAIYGLIPEQMLFENSTYGMSPNDHALLGTHFGWLMEIVVFSVIVAFSIWAVARLIAARERGIVAWMFAGHFFVIGVMRLAGIASGLLAIYATKLFPGLTSQSVSGTIPPALSFKSGAGLLSIFTLATLLLVIGLLSLAIVSGRMSRATDWLFTTLKKHALPLLVVWHLPMVWILVMRLTLMRSPSVPMDGSEPVLFHWHLVGSSFTHASTLTPYFAVALAIAAAAAVMRPGLQDSDENQDVVSA